VDAQQMMQDRLAEIKEQIQDVAGFDPTGMTVREAFEICEREEGCTVYWGFWTPSDLDREL